MRFSPAETDSKRPSKGNISEGCNDSSRTLFDSLPFIILFAFGMVCVIVLPMTIWPFAGGLAVLSLFAGRRLERRLLEDTTIDIYESLQPVRMDDALLTYSATSKNQPSPDSYTNDPTVRSDQTVS